MSLESPFKADILKGKVALITGGGSGIGFEISTQFGKHGASVAIMGRRKQVLDAAVSALRSLGIKVSFQRIYIYFFSSGFVFFTMIIAHFVPACMFALFFFLVLAFHLLYGSFDLLCQFIFLLLNCLGSDYTIFFFSIFRVYLPMLLWELMVGSTAGKILLGGTIGMRFEPGSHE